MMNLKSLSMRIPKNIFVLVASGLIAANIGYLTQSLAGGLLALAFFSLIPGYLVLKLWMNFRVDRWTMFSLSFGLSLLVMIVGGLLLNSLHFIGLDRPLSFVPILAMLDVVTGGLLCFSHKSLRQQYLSRPIIKVEHTLFVIGLSSLPLFGTLGAIRLNNGGSGAVTVLGLGLAAVMFLLLLWRRHLKSLYPYAVFTIGLTVLLALAMRSWLVSGHDVIHEYQLFTQVVQHGFWGTSLSFVGDTYNACMSITILPTIIASITNISNEYVFKLIMQIIFALGLVPMYLLANQLSGSRRALLASLLFVSFPTFVNDMPFLVRQEVAFIFFALLLLVAFLKLGRKFTAFLAIAFMAGLVLSHYSSGYVALAILFIAWAAYKFINKITRSKASFSTPLLSLPILVTCLLFTFLWNAQVTATSGTLSDTVMSTITGMFSGSSTRSNSVSYGLVSGDSKTSDEVLADYAGDKSDLVAFVPEQNMEPTSLGERIADKDTLHGFNAVFRWVSAKGLQLLLLIGVVYFFIRKRLSAGRRDVYLYSLALGSIVMMGLITVLPQLSVDYGLTRLFLQTMVIVGIPIILGLELLLGAVRKLKHVAAAVLVALFFLHLTGFIPQLIGGYPPQMTLNNAGYYYDIYYHHQGEHIATDLLNTGAYSDLRTSADKYAISRFQGVVKHGPITDPVKTTDTSDYLYADHANVHTGLQGNFIEGNVMEYSYDDPTLQSKLYSNQSSHIVLRVNTKDN